ncbi:MAG: exodeoxyribonuclease V subunit gamma, partial [Planctomycetes bacterium]|nr:exodeoxyribonuclease V subunit gamma [Planctomycetota bacterium]
RGTSSGPLAGFVDRLGAAIAEFIEEAISPDDLAELGDAGPSSPGDTVQRAKLHDLLLIYRAYLDFLGDDKLDPTQHLELARDCLPQCDWLGGAELWVDGFASFSGQETLTLIELARFCSNVEITALLDPRLVVSAGQSAASAPPSAHFFARPFKTYQDLDRRLRGHGLTVNDPLVLAPKTPPRFAPESDLARVERFLFDSDDNSRPEKAGAGLEIVELPSLRVEVEYAVSRVCRWVQDSAARYRYRDIALIVRDLEPYHDLLTQALAARNIPFFIDRRRPTTHHPLVELLRALVLVASEDLSVESVRLLLKTGLLPLAQCACDELENYLIAHGIAGASAWTGPNWAHRERQSVVDLPPEPTAREIQSLERINASRTSLNECLGPWLKVAARDGSRTGSEWSAALMDWLTRVEVGRTLQGWASDAEAGGDLDQAEEHRQVWRDVVSLLDDLAYALADAPLTISELGDVLDSGLSGLTLGLVPPTVDQVLVGSIERSRHPDIKAAVILGFNEGVFPRPVTEDTILNDEDRDLMTGAGLPVRPASRDRLLDEMMLAYIALTRASEALVVTYAASDNAGKVTAPAPYIKDIQAAVPGLEVDHVDDPHRSRDMWSLLSVGDLPGRLCMEFRARPPLDRDDGPLRMAWNELYDAVRFDLARDRTQRWAFSALDEQAVDKVTASQMKRFQKGPLRSSVSRLETYAACPFQYFARYMLGLQERREAVFRDVDVGQVHHAILEDFVQTLSDRGQGFGSLSDDELMGGLADTCSRIAMRLPTDASLSDARNGYLLRRAAQDLEGVIRAQRTLGRASAFRPRFVELPFGFPDEGDVPALEVALRLPQVGYIGAMGSRQTHEERLNRLREVGLTETELA